MTRLKSDAHALLGLNCTSPDELIDELGPDLASLHFIGSMNTPQLWERFWAETKTHDAAVRARLVSIHPAEPSQMARVASYLTRAAMGVTAVWPMAETPPRPLPQTRHATMA